jgi:NitT/TauT family transport system ATP-binding protein
MLFREAALSRVTLLQQMKSALKSKSDHKMPLEFFHDVLDEHFTETDVIAQLQTALNWGRYIGLFTYDPESDTLQLHETPQHSSEDVHAH